MKNCIEYILSKNAQRNIGLDVIRSFAILVTVYGHGVLLVSPNYRSIHNVFISAFDGVSLFFVLSGYLIGGILVNELSKNNFSIGQFWMRRWLRTLPAYFFTYLILILFAFGNGTFQLDYLKYLYFFQNLFGPAYFFFSESWSLSIEEWFYILFPLVILVFLGYLKNIKRALSITILLFFIGPILYTFYQYQNAIGLDDWDAHYRRIVATRLNSIALGILLVYLQKYVPNIWLKLEKKGMKLAVLCVILSFIIPKINFHTLVYNIFLRSHLECLIAFFAIPYLTTIKELPYPFLTKWIRIISIISYSMYLINLSFLLRNVLVPFQKTASFIALGNLGYFLIYITYWVLLFIFSILMYRYIEFPFLKLRDNIKVKSLFKITEKQLTNINSTIN